MSQESLENFRAYRLAMELFDLVVEDTGQVERHPQTYRLIGQQVASADSICSNIEEGHGRETTKDYTHFLVMARGSARETRGRYVRMKHWLPPDVVADRTKRCDVILGILSKTIFSLRSRVEAGGSRSEGRTPSPHAPVVPSLPVPSPSAPPAPTPSSPC
jgi:four helix bundle protein